MVTRTFRWPKRYELVPSAEFPGRVWYASGRGWYASPGPASVRPGRRVVVDLSNSPPERVGSLPAGASIAVWGVDADGGWWGGPRDSFK